MCSPGQQQQLCLARLLLGAPDVALLDEVTSALDEDSEALIYAALVASCATIVSVGLTVYRWLFERGSVMEMNLLLVLLPVISFGLTVAIIKSQVPLRVLPWFGRLGGLVMMIAAALVIMWAIDRTRIVFFSLVKVQYLLLIFLGLLLLIRIGWRRFVG